MCLHWHVQNKCTLLLLSVTIFLWIAMPLQHGCHIINLSGWRKLSWPSLLTDHNTESILGFPGITRTKLTLFLFFMFHKINLFALLFSVSRSKSHINKSSSPFLKIPSHFCRSLFCYYDTLQWSNGHIKMSNIDVFFVVFVELYTYIIALIIFKVTMHFIWSPTTITSQTGLANVTQPDVNKALINCLVCEHFCLSHLRQIDFHRQWCV